MKLRSLVISGAVLCVSLMFMGASCGSSGTAEGDSGAGVYVSADKAETWQQISAYPRADGVTQLTGVSVYRFFDDPNDANALYWASREKGMFFSYDEGRNWQSPEDTVNDGFIYSIAVNPIDKCTVYVSTGAHVFKTEDCNRTWTNVYRETRGSAHVSSVSISHANPNAVYLAVSNGEVLKSTDTGASWNLVNRFETEIDKVIADPWDPQTVYVSSIKRGLYRTDDGGATWTDTQKLFRGFSKSTQYRRLFLDPVTPNKVFWISKYGILVSYDKGESWAPMTLLTPPGSVDIYGFAVNPNNADEIYYSATVQGRSTLYRSQDGGVNWTTKKLPSQQVPTAIRVHPEKEHVVYVGFTIPPK